MLTPAWSLQCTLVLYRLNMKTWPNICLRTKDKKREREKTNVRSLKFSAHEHHNTAAASDVHRTTEVLSSGAKGLFLPIQSCHVDYLVTPLTNVFINH
jgi:hypothetical protein